MHHLAADGSWSILVLGFRFEGPRSPVSLVPSCWWFRLLDFKYFSLGKPSRAFLSGPPNLVLASLLLEITHKAACHQLQLMLFQGFRQDFHHTGRPTPAFAVQNLAGDLPFTDHFGISWWAWPGRFFFHRGDLHSLPLLQQSTQG